MKVTTRKAAFGGLAMFGAAVLLAGCASAPEDSGESDGAAASDFLPCMVSDAGGFDDKSFNQLGFEGLTKAGRRARRRADHRRVRLRDRLRAEHRRASSTRAATSSSPSASPSRRPPARRPRPTPTSSSSRSTTWSTTTSTARPTPTNIKPIVFDTAQAAFLAGYAAADYSKTGVVGTFGGMNFPTVSIFMDGFKQGVDYYNTEKGTNVQVLGWDGTDGLFTGGFEANDTARQHRAGPHRPGRRRAPARRRPDLPVRRRGHPRLRP